MNTTEHHTTMDDQINENNVEKDPIQDTTLAENNSNANVFGDIDKDDNDDSEDDDIDIIDRTTNEINAPNSSANLFHFQPSSSSSLFNNLLNHYQFQQQISNAYNNNNGNYIASNQNLFFNLPRQSLMSLTNDNLNKQTLATNTEFLINPNRLNSANSAPTGNIHPSMSSNEQFQLKENIQNRFAPTDTTSSDQNSMPQPSSSQEWLTSNNLIETRNKLRKKLTYHFMSPIDKWRMKGKFPWKLLFQIIKIILVTIQVILFGNNFASNRSIDNSMIMTLHNIFLFDWESSREFKTFPPTVGPYAVYRVDDMYRHIDYAILNYSNITNLAFGSFGYQLKRNKNQVNSTGTNRKQLSMSPINFCFTRYANVTLDPSFDEYFIDLNVEEKCFQIDNLYPPGSDEWTKFSFYQYLKKNYPEQIDIQSLIHLTFKFPLNVMLLNTLSTYNLPECFNLNLDLNFNNKPHSGEIVISMAMNKFPNRCFGNLKSNNHEQLMHIVTILINVIVIMLCIMSLILCSRTLLRSQSLRKETSQFFLVAYNRNLETSSLMHFIDGWILMILLNDILLIIGTSINLLKKFDIIGPNKVNLLNQFQLDKVCSAFLGVGLLLVWFGILRYLAFFDEYNVLFVTIKHSLARVLRFLICVLVLFAGFCFSGWIILGPYHFKFYTLARTSECLFALMNGDDVFATFAYLDSSSLFVWWFSRIYLYSFVLLFIYVVLSLFISILMDSYETIKQFYLNKNRRKISIDFVWSNDQLSRFLLANFENDDETETIPSYRMNHINDQSREYYQQNNFGSCLTKYCHNIYNWFFCCNQTADSLSENEPLNEETQTIN